MFGPSPSCLLGLTSEGGQGESQVLDWLAEEGDSDWLNSFFTSVYGLINPLEPLEEEEGTAAKEDEEEEEGGAPTKKTENEAQQQEQKIVIVGLQNQ